MIFLANSLKAKLVALIGTVLAATVLGLLASVNLILVREHDRGGRESLLTSVSSVRSYLASQSFDLEVQARLVGELPILSTVLEGGNPATIRDAAVTYKENLGIPVLDILDTDAGRLASAGDTLLADDTLPSPLLEAVLENGSARGVFRSRRGLVLLGLSIIGNSEEPGGVILLARPLDSAYLRRLEGIAKTGVSVLDGDATLVSTLASGEAWRDRGAEAADSATGVRRFFSGKSYRTAEIILPDWEGKPLAGGLALHHSLRKDREVLTTLRFILLAIGGTLFLLAAAAAYRFSSGMTRPLAEAVDFARNLAKGDTDKPIAVTRRDEIGTLQDSLEKMRVSIKELLGNLDAKIREVTGMQRHVRNILDNLDSGFLQFDSAGRIQPGYSRTSEVFFGEGLEGKLLEEVLRIDPGVWGSISVWREILFSGTMPFQDAAPLGPSRFEKIPGRQIELQYRPVHEDGRLVGVILVAMDKTMEQELVLKSQRERERADLIMKISGDREGFLDFVKDTKSIIARLQALTAGDILAAEDMDQLFRGLHTIKGNAAMYAVSEARDMAHHLENELANLRSRAEAGISEELPRLRTGLVGLEDALEKTLEANKSILGDSALLQEGLRRVTVPGSALARMEREMLARFHRDSELFRLFVDTFMLEPLLPALKRFEGVAGSVAERRGKLLKPVVWNGDAKVRMSAYKGLIASLVHAFRNAVDHGIEAPEDREAAGKDPEGQLTVEVGVTGTLPHRLRIAVRDDGGGIDPARIREKAVKKGLLTAPEAEGMGDAEIVQLVFRNGFSTNDSVTDISGRGVGMDAILYEAKKLGGTAWIETVTGEGSVLRIEVTLFTEPEADSAGDVEGLPGLARMDSPSLS